MSVGKIQTYVEKIFLCDTNRKVKNPKILIDFSLLFCFRFLVPFVCIYICIFIYIDLTIPKRGLSEMIMNPFNYVDRKSAEVRKNITKRKKKSQTTNRILNLICLIERKIFECIGNYIYVKRINKNMGHIFENTHLEILIKIQNKPEEKFYYFYKLYWEFFMFYPTTTIYLLPSNYKQFLSIIYTIKTP